jgi:hypothetical protein
VLCSNSHFRPHPSCCSALNRDRCLANAYLIYRAPEVLTLLLVQGDKSTSGIPQSVRFFAGQQCKRRASFVPVTANHDKLIFHECLIFSKALVRPLQYRLFKRLETMPSNSKAQVCRKNSAPIPAHAR